MKKLLLSLVLVLGVCLTSCSKDYRELSASYSHKVSKASDSGLHMTFNFSDGNTPKPFIEALENGKYELTSMYVDDNKVYISDFTDTYFKVIVTGKPGSLPITGQIVNIVINYKSCDK